MTLDLATNELQLKLVYYGPGLAGKTTSMQYVFVRMNPGASPRMLALSAEFARTLSFNFATALPPIDGKRIRLFLHTVPGPVFNDPSRRLVLKGVDGVVFVADAQVERAVANLESFEELQANLESHGRSLTGVPLVLQYNKCDLPNRMSPADLRALLNSQQRFPEHETVARAGIGVFDVLKTVTTLMVERARSASDKT